jgi:hypothetical protein
MLNRLLYYIQNVYTCFMRADGQRVATLVYVHSCPTERWQTLSYANEYSKRQSHIVRITEEATDGTSTLLEFFYLPKWKPELEETVLCRSGSGLKVRLNSKAGTVRLFRGEASSQDTTTSDIVQTLVDWGILLDDYA